MSSKEDLFFIERDMGRGRWCCSELVPLMEFIIRRWSLKRWWSTISLSLRWLLREV